MITTPRLLQPIGRVFANIKVVKKAIFQLEAFVATFMRIVERRVTSST